jgi:type VI secretion system protein ImpJ
MFLWPHQMQLAERHGVRQLHLSHKWDLHHDWGLRWVDLDVGALANYRFAVKGLRARLRDGTLLAIPDDGSLAAIDLKPAFQKGSSVDVSLGVPKLQLGKSNVRDPQQAPPPGAAPATEKVAPTRYLLSTEEVEDENVSNNPQPIPVRLLTFKLLLSTEDQSGFEVLRLARIRRGDAPDAPPQLDRTYIPPVLACDAWPILAADIVQAVYHLVGKTVEELSARVVSRGINFDSRSQKDPLIFTQLHILNEAYSLLGTLAFAEGIHPLPAYLELCRLVGQLAIFGDARKAPELPRYDHDDLGGCFWAVKKHIDDLLQEVEPPTYKERAFQGQELRMQVALEPEWLQPAWQMFVGVDSPLVPEECIRLLTRAGQLDMKIGSAERVDDIFILGSPGLRFTPRSTASRTRRSGATSRSRGLWPFG